jgi:hypothetical protein
MKSFLKTKNADFFGIAGYLSIDPTLTHQFGGIKGKQRAQTGVQIDF